MFKTLVVFVALGQACNGVYAALSGVDGSACNALFALGTLWIGGEFCRREFAARYGRGLVDAGFLFGWSWLFAVPYFLFRGRGLKRGIIAVGIVLLAYVLPYAIGFLLASVGAAAL
jgi:hypothetical protein